MTMKKLTAADPESHSLDLVAENIEWLKVLFPELVTEGSDGAAVNIDVLKTLVGDATVTDAEEKYGLKWSGKRRSRQLALTPSAGTLRPCPEDSVDWDTTQNLMIEGDNLEVLKLLQKSYARKVKLIYIDPPYNTGNDFVYRDNYQDSIKSYLELTGQVEGGAQISSNTETSGRFHTEWLNMMYPRLKCARNLLRDDGLLIISIDDQEAINLRKVCDELLGEENFICQFVWKSKSGGANDSRHVAVDHEYLIAYARRIEEAQLSLDADAEVTTTYSQKDEHGEFSLERLDKQSLGYMESLDFPITGPDGMVYRVEHKNPAQKVARWRWGKTTVEERYGELVFRDGYVYTKNYKKEGAIPRSLLIEERFGRTRSGKTELADLMGAQIFDNPKPTKLLQHILAITTGARDLIVDFFAGSGTMGHAAFARNAKDGGARRFILVQLPERLDPDSKDQKRAAEFCDKLGKPRNIAELTKERLRRAAKRIEEENPMFAGDRGFRVFKLDVSNIRAWEPDRGDLDRTLLDAVEHVMPGRTEADVLYELLLKHGLDLCLPIEKRTLGEKDVYAIGGGVLMACLAEKIERGDVEALAQGIVEWHKVLAPAGDTTCVFRDSAFADDVAKTNLAAILEQHGVTNVRSL